MSVATPLRDQEDVRLKDELLSVLLHDLRSPLGAITALADLIATISKRGEAADGKQVQLLQDAVTRAQRVLDDAFEIQAILRGNYTLMSTIIDVETIIKCCVDKALHAPYFLGGEIEVDFQHDKGAIRIDVEKTETVLLCLMEQMILHTESAPFLKISTASAGHYVAIRFENQPNDKDAGEHHPIRQGMRGRLGTRRLGESRYSLQVCQKVLHLMSARLDLTGHPLESAEIRLPRATG